jgi:nitroimidazol reductase NimA-like FMN-containing flavoprotein (pyridoxamine 5'-phosphate oxidase superfamily)
LYPHTEKLQNEINRIINKCDVGYIAMVDKDNSPYVIPMNFGLDGKHIYLHSGKEGKNLDILKNNNSVSVSFSTDHQMYIRNEAVACSYTMKYRSVLAHGLAEFIEDKEDKILGMNVIMKHYSGKKFTYNLPAINNVCVLRVVVEKFEARVYGY